MIEALISFMFSFLTGVILYDTKHIHTTVYHLKANNIKKSLRICMLADLHGVSFRGDYLYKRVVKENPDIIIMAGDMCNAKFSFSDESAIRLVRKLSRKYPVYYGLGNHESRLEWSPELFDVSYKNVIRSLKIAGARVLNNRTVFLKEYGINVTGLTLSEDYYKKIFKKHTNKKSIKGFIGEKKDGFEILIAHNPEYFKDYVRRGSDLILSGHLHGGIMRLPFSYGAISPRFTPLPRYAGGLYKSKSSKMIVSRGLGQHTLPVRVFNTAELVVIDIEKED